jgi:hypothetical protein
MGIQDMHAAPEQSKGHRNMQMGLALEDRMAMSSSKSKPKSLFILMQPWSDMEHRAVVMEHFFIVGKRAGQFMTQELQNASPAHHGCKSKEQSSCVTRNWHPTREERMATTLHTNTTACLAIINNLNSIAE